MKDKDKHKIYIFNSKGKEGEKIETQVYALNFYQAFDGMVNIFPYNDCFDIAGMEETTLPEEWTFKTNEIRLSN